jgi:hypothetical protein
MAQVQQNAATRNLCPISYRLFSGSSASIMSVEPERRNRKTLLKNNLQQLFAIVACTGLRSGQFQSPASA